MEGRNTVFQTLKPICVALGQAAVALNGQCGDIQAVTDRLEALQDTLKSVTSKPEALDATLADYAFFPISQVLRVSQKVSIRCLELCLQCLSILIDQGWKQQLQPQLATQLVILCTMLAEKTPKGLSFSETTDELQQSAFRCLYNVFSVARMSQECRNLLTSEANFPQLGQTISVMLDGAADGRSVEVQVTANSALQALITGVNDREMNASFMPGVVSRMTKVLAPQTKLRRNHEVLIGSMQLIGYLLRSTLSDFEPPATISGHVNRESSKAERTVIDESWREQAATQLKAAFQQITRLRTHDREDVKDALAQLCQVILKRCRKWLASCSALALETWVFIASGKTELERAAEIETLVKADSSITVLLQNMLYDWLQSLTTVMQSGDEQSKASKIQQISTAYRILQHAATDTGMLERVLASTLRDSVATTLSLPGTQSQLQPIASPIPSLDVNALGKQLSSTKFISPLVKYRAQEEVMGSIEQLTELIGTSSGSSIFATELLRSLRQSEGNQLLSSFWLLYSVSRKALQGTDDIDNLLNLEGDAHAMHQDNLEELYAFSLSILNDSSYELEDVRLRAIALRCLAVRAESAGQDFRYELVDALYPVLHTLATPDEQLQTDSVVTLNILAAACGYPFVKELIVENADYLTNAVALKLNAFDISPQAPQVLLMMVRLAGHGLLPYLEDTVESIFAALEAYHGYPLLVELLFQVLRVMAEEGIRAPQLAFTDRRLLEPENSISPDRWQPTTLGGLVTLLRLQAEEDAESQAIRQEDLEHHPQHPWKSLEEVDDHGEGDGGSNHDQQLDDTETPPPAPKTYNLLFKITELTQHFLPSASPALRASLLALISTTVPAIGKHENSFLPLINTLWPEIVSRLDDEEPQIIIAALNVVRVLCDYAGDFMRSRIVQLWPRLGEIYYSTAIDILRPSTVTEWKATNPQKQVNSVMARGTSLRKELALMRLTPANVGDTSSRLTWEALISTICSAVQHGHLPPEVFDEALQMLEPVIEQTDVRTALDHINADAVWLARARQGGVPIPPTPRAPDDMFWRFAEAAG